MVEESSIWINCGKIIEKKVKTMVWDRRMILRLLMILLRILISRNDIKISSKLTNHLYNQESFIYKIIYIF